MLSNNDLPYHWIQVECVHIVEFLLWSLVPFPLCFPNVLDNAEETRSLFASSMISRPSRHRSKDRERQPTGSLLSPLFFFSFQINHKICSLQEKRRPLSSRSFRSLHVYTLSFFAFVSFFSIHFSSLPFFSFSLVSFFATPASALPP